MCLAVVGKILELQGPDGVADVEGNRVNVVTVAMPDVKVGDCVLVHAGFAIAIIDEEEYRQRKRTFDELDEYARKTLENK